MLAAAAVAALALSACGGGGGSVSGGAGPAAVPPVAYANVAPKAAQAAATTPVFARQGTSFRSYDHLSVFMTSTGVSSAFNGETFQFPPAAIFTRRSAPGRMVAFLAFTTAGSSALNTFNDTKDDDWRETVRQQDTVGSLTRFRIDATSNDTDNTIDDDRGLVAHIVFYTDYDIAADSDGDGTAGDDTDFMAIAIWDQGPHAKDDSRGSTHSGAGAVATGRAPYTGLDSDHNSLTAVTYSGTAGGKRFSGGTVTDFTTTVSLTANFSSTATISGTVADVAGGQQLKLQSASIDRANDGGPFTGNTQLLDSDGNQVTGFAGKWGGAFFGAQDSTNGPPGTAGTFGVTGGDPSDTVLGAFIAHRQQ